MPKINWNITDQELKQEMVSSDNCWHISKTQKDEFATAASEGCFAPLQLIYFPPHKYKEKGTLRSGVLFILSADADKVGSNDYLNDLRIQKKNRRGEPDGSNQGTKFILYGIHPAVGREFFRSVHGQKSLNGKDFSYRFQKRSL